MLVYLDKFPLSRHLRTTAVSCDSPSFATTAASSHNVGRPFLEAVKKQTILERGSHNPRRTSMITNRHGWKDDWTDFKGQGNPLKPGNNRRTKCLSILGFFVDVGSEKSHIVEHSSNQNT
jgi:hypothetical protein